MKRWYFLRVSKPWLWRRVNRPLSAETNRSKTDRVVFKDKARITCCGRRGRALARCPRALRHVPVSLGLDRGQVTRFGQGTPAVLAPLPRTAGLCRRGRHGKRAGVPVVDFAGGRKKPSPYYSTGRRGLPVVTAQHSVAQRSRPSKGLSDFT